MMKQRLRLSVIIFGCLLLTEGKSQESGYLAQKLMVENHLRERITGALSKVIDESRYVVDVSVELELSDAVEEQVTFFTEENKPAPTKQRESLGEIHQPRSDDSKASIEVESMVGLPIPGFEFEVERKPEIAPKPEIISKPAEEITPPKKKGSDLKILSKTSSYKRPSTARTKRHYL